MTRNIASPDLVQAMVKANELALRVMGDEPPRDPDLAAHWTMRRTRLQAELAGFARTQAQAAQSDQGTNPTGRGYPRTQ